MTWWEVLVQQSINGLTRGAVFALIALGYTMVYGIIELITFAHGDVFMLGLFISLAWFALLGVTTTLTGWQLLTLLPLVFLLTMLTTAILNVAIDRVAYRPLRRSRRLAPLITAIGVSFMLENVALLWKGPAPIAYPDVFPSVDILREWFGKDYNIGQWWMGYQAGLRAFTAAVLGGIGNMPGAALGGLAIGFLSAWSDQYISARWTNAIVFSILILVLVFRPQGLMGARTVDKV